MPGQPILDVAIGLTFIFLLLSLMVTAANELIASSLRRRPATLWRGIVRLLGGEDTAASVYAHPLIAALSDESWFKNIAAKPSYISSRTFVTALLDTLAQSGGIRAALDQRLAKDPHDHLAKSLLVLWTDDAEQFQQRLEQWFNSSMDRVSGWYKRRTQWIGFLFAVIIAITLNADTISIFNALWRDPAVRAIVVAQAERSATDQSQPRLETLSIPLGWQNGDIAQWRGHIFGWLLTALAISLGAPFWFDTLSKVISIRASGKAPPAPS